MEIGFGISPRPRGGYVIDMCSNDRRKKRFVVKLPVTGQVEEKGYLIQKHSGLFVFNLGMEAVLFFSMQY